MGLVERFPLVKVVGQVFGVRRWRGSEVGPLQTLIWAAG